MTEFGVQKGRAKKFRTADANRRRNPCEIIEASPNVKDLGKRAVRALVNGCRQITAQYTAYVAALESGGRRKRVRAADAKCGKERLEEEKPVSKVVQEERSRPSEVTQRLR